MQSHHAALAALTISTLAQLDAALVQRWSFNEPDTSLPAGTVLEDSLASSPAVVRGQGTTISSGQLVLPGATNASQPESSISGYLDLPNGTVSRHTDLTLEFWAAPLGGREWAALFDFGSWNAPGDGLGAPREWTGLSQNAPPSNTQTHDALALLLSRGTDLDQQRLGITREGNRTSLDTGLPTSEGQTYHYVVTVTDAVGSFGSNGMRVAWYRDNSQVGSRDVPYHLADIEDVNCWIGRLQWSGLGMAYVAIDEFRIYDHALSPSEIATSFAAGPDPVTAPPLLQPDRVILHPRQKVRIDVLANDPPAASNSPITVIQAPQFGTATATPDGTILYAHTHGNPMADTFSYTTSSTAGLADPVEVTISFADSLRIPANFHRVPLSPPVTTVVAEPAFGSLTFNQPVNLASISGDPTRLFVVERRGSIRLIPDVTAAEPGSTLFFNLASHLSSRGEAVGSTFDQGLMSMAVHPDFATNRSFFLFYSVRVLATGSEYFRISKFEAQSDNPDAADPSSEQVLIQQRDPNGYHLGTDMHFGNDGYLYISTGDGGGQNDSRRYGQRIDRDFHCALLRIDVDRRPGSREPNPHPSVPTDGTSARYAIPADNPFVTDASHVSFNGQNLPTASVRTEFFATGLRNPFRFSVDPPTGEIWIGDVGQNAREEINLVTPGANFGWSWREGTLPGPNAGGAATGFSPTPPLYEYSIGSGSFEGHSVTGGFVYRGTRLPALTGAYVFADYVDGHIWALRRDPGIAVERLTGNPGQVALAPDPSNGDILMVDIQEGRILRLVAGTDTGGFPRRLSETGLFSDLADLSPSPGLLPYQPNLPFWSDHATKKRWFAVPSSDASITWHRDANWTFPTGSLWVKHFDLELERGNPSSARRIETRLLVKNDTGCYGVSYRWNEAGTDADLVPDAGAAFTLEITEGGLQRQQDYQIPSRAACIACHNPAAGHALSFNTRQLNRSADIHGFTGNQLTLLHTAGYLSGTSPFPDTLPRHLRADESTFPIEARVRAYLAVNCANCHRSGGPAPTAFDLRPELTLDATRILQTPALNDGGNPGNQLVTPGDPAHSVLLHRIDASAGFSRMPPLGTTVLDTANSNLVSEWISAHLPSRQGFDAFRTLHFGSPDAPAGSPDFDPDHDGRTNLEEFLEGTHPLDPASALKLSIAPNGNGLAIRFELPPNRTAQIEGSSDLQSWAPVDAPGNGSTPTPGGMAEVIAPGSLTPSSYFRLRVSEN